MGGPRQTKHCNMSVCSRLTSSLCSQAHCVAIAALVFGTALSGCSPGGEGEPAGGGDGDGNVGMGGAEPSDGLGGAEGDGDVDVEYREPVEDEVLGPAGQAFVPDDIQYVHVGENEIQFTLVASTLIQSAGLFEEPAWYAAFRNDGLTTVCVPGVAFEFKNAAGQVIADDNAVGQVNSPMYMSYGDPSHCLAPGDIGMMESDIPLRDINVADVESIEYQGSGALTLSARPIEDVNFSDLELVVDGDRTKMTGRLNNGLFETIETPEVFVYAVDAVGRPYALMDEIDLVEIAPGGHWEFETLSTEEEVENFVIFADYRYPF